MDIRNKVAYAGLARNVGTKILPILVLVLIWLWVLLFIAIIGLNLDTLHTLFGWTAMMGPV